MSELAILKERVDALYEKESYRVLTESKLIEEIIRLEKLEAEFKQIVLFVKEGKIKSDSLKYKLNKITTVRLSECAAEIAAKDIIPRIIRRLEGMYEDDY